MLLQLQAERNSIEEQFEQLYHDKYQPLKMSHQAALESSQQLQEQQQQAVEKLHTQLATTDLKVRKAGLDVQSLTQQLQKSQDELQVQPYPLPATLICCRKPNGSSLGNTQQKSCSAVFACTR